MNLLVKKSVNPETGEIWFTHARLRSVAFNLGKLIPNKTLFNFLNNCEVKSMNNVHDGGINSPIRHLLNCHRGTNFTGQQKIVEIYLLKRSMFWNKISMLLNSKKPTFLQHSSVFWNYKILADTYTLKYMCQHYIKVYKLLLN